MVEVGKMSLGHYYSLGWLRRLLMIFALAVTCIADIALADVEQPEGYRMALYDDEVPSTLDGASTITAVEVKLLQETAAAVVIDVIPQHRRPSALPDNQIWIPVDHKGVPGAIWLPDTGYGALSDTTEEYFKHHLDVATKGNRNHPVIFYCRANCWMSWNAAKRALSYGYTDVYWFFEGIDGWLFEDFEVEVLNPEEGQRQVEAVFD